ncbi:MAG: chorismate synthase [Thermovirgaceae bacterium]|nr:chorismate synthase [Thermovirgaceae bacterium]
MSLRFLTSGESHGRGFLVNVEGLPAGLIVSTSALRAELARRRRGFGRGPRMKLEKDLLGIWGGLRDGLTTGSPLGLVLENTEWEQWRPVLDPESVDSEAAASRAATCPRPGHADLAGAIKYGHRDIRNVIERASARLTAAWTLAGTVARMLLAELGVDIRGAVTSIGGVPVKAPVNEEEWERARTNDLGCPRPGDEAGLIEQIRMAGEEGDTLGGTFLVSLKGLPPGIGSHVEWDRRLDGRFAAGLMGIPGIKGVEVGEGFRLGGVPGSMAHDEIVLRRGQPVRLSNRAGGLEGGMTNGEEVLLHAVMKPIPTLRKPLRSVDISTGKETSAHFERSDVCAVPAACVVGEAMAAWVAACAVSEQFGGDILDELQQRFADYRQRVEDFVPHGAE